MVLEKHILNFWLADKRIVHSLTEHRAAERLDFLITIIIGLVIDQQLVFNDAVLPLVNMNHKFGGFKDKCKNIENSKEHHWASKSVVERRCVVILIVINDQRLNKVAY